MASDVTSRIFAPRCQGCAARSTCLGVRREYLDQWGDRGLVPFEAPVGEARGRDLRGPDRVGASRGDALGQK
jgi:hypothetical protein